MRKLKAAFWFLTALLLVYCVVGLKYHQVIDFKTYETIGTVIAALWVVPAWATFADAIAS